MLANNSRELIVILHEFKPDFSAEEEPFYVCVRVVNVDGSLIKSYSVCSNNASVLHFYAVVTDFVYLISEKYDTFLDKDDFSELV